MTIVRRDGMDAAVPAWIRNNPGLDSKEHCVATTDQDFWWIGYRPKVDGKRTRDLKLLLHIEWKTHGKEPDFCQREILLLNHQAYMRSPGTKAYCKKCGKLISHAVIPEQVKDLTCQYCGAIKCGQILREKGIYFDMIDGRGAKVTTWHFGSAVAIFPGVGPCETWSDRPGGDKKLLWGRFDERGNIIYSEIPVYHLESMLRWEKLPDPPFEKLDTRCRHHWELEMLAVKTGYGFTTWEKRIIIS